MTLKKVLKTQLAQSIVEYVVVFVVIALGIIVVFRSFNPDNVSIKDTFDGLISRAISQINR